MPWINIPPAELADGALVTATNTTSDHAITGRWNARNACLEFDSVTRRGAYAVPVEQLAGFRFTQH